MTWWNPFTWFEGDSEFYDPSEDLSDENLRVETGDQRMPWHDREDRENDE